MIFVFRFVLLWSVFWFYVNLIAPFCSNIHLKRRIGVKTIRSWYISDTIKRWERTRCSYYCHHSVRICIRNGGSEWKLLIVVYLIYDKEEIEIVLWSHHACFVLKGVSIKYFKSRRCSSYLWSPFCSNLYLKKREDRSENNSIEWVLFNISLKRLYEVF